LLENVENARKYCDVECRSLARLVRLLDNPNWAKKETERIRAKNKRNHTAKPRLAEHRESHLKIRYGISSVEYNQLWKKQKGVCAICKRPETIKRKGKVRKLCIDHCHATGVIRKLLCAKCNLLIGHADDSSHTMKKAAAYLEEYGL
jgi:hypothetical protein